jgi:protein-L-isoaspartate(D-aspartate) O-methyltransferase
MGGAAGAAETADPYVAARRAMVEDVRRHVADTRAELQRHELDARVVEALRTVPRHEFVPRDQRKRAYDDRPLPIGYGQTISQPYIVAVMTELLEVKPGSRVLEIGTGSGYQAAVLAQMGAKVFTMEIVPELGEAARERLGRLGYDKAEARVGDGYYGWEDRAPFDAIIVTAAANHIPPPLLAQLKSDGRMVIPLGNPFGMQHLLIVRKEKDGRTATRKVLPVRFVPLTGRAQR